MFKPIRDPHLRVIYSIGLSIFKQLLASSSNILQGRGFLSIEAQNGFFDINPSVSNMADHNISKIPP
jgi:hypothetical protein